MSLAARWQEQIEQLQAEGRYRQLTAPAGIDFSSNDYLGYSARQWPAVDGERSGTASRLLRGNHAIWPEVESTLAQWHAADTALMFTSGYTANEGLLNTIIEPNDWVASDQLNHASIIDGLRLSKAERFVYRHNDLDHLEQGLRQAVRAQARRRERFIVTESLFGMEGDLAPLTDLAATATRYGANLIVDEAHATGCFGATGSGLVDQTGVRGQVLATVHTGGKALGVPGAYVVGSAALKEMLVNRCRHLIFTTALAPVIGRWWLQVLEEVATDHGARARLCEAAQAFRAILGAHGVRCRGDHFIVPRVLGEDAHAVNVAREMQAAGYDVRAIRPPTVPNGTARIRMSIHANHNRQTLLDAATALAELVPEAACKTC
jgi:8-amino-7-oxononanoate synthase